MGYLSASDLSALGFRRLGRNVKISDKASIYNAANIEIGDNCRIDDFCLLSAGVGGIAIGSQVHLAPYVSLIGASLIRLGDFTGLSSKTALYSSTDDFSGRSLTGPCVPDQFRSVTNADVILGRHVIVGVGVMILPGVTIGDGVAVGSMSLVNGDCTPFGLYVGIPAKKVKDRSQDLLALENEYSKWLLENS